MVRAHLGALIKPNFNKMTKRTRWTVEEDKILVQAIKANPHNKTKAFKEVSLKTNRSIPSVSSRWYQHLSNPESKHYVGCMFTMIGIASRLDNRTVNRDNTHITPMKNKRGLWAKIKALLGL